MRLLALFLFSLLLFQIEAEGNEEPQFRQPVNCAKQRDGNYVWGCSRFYSICTNGRELPMQCYAGLKLNPDNNQCDSPAAIDVCNDPNSSSQLYRSKDPFNCAEQSDGLYEANPCSPGYIQCTQGRRFDQTCPNGLIFNSNAGVCDYASKCKKTKPKKRVVKKIAYASQQPILQDPFSNPNSPPAPQSPQPYNNQQQYRQPTQSNPSTAVQDDPPQTSPSFDCVGKTDGLYVQNEGGCNNGFWKCAHGQAFIYNCSAGLVYNDQNGQCDYPRYVTACGGTPINPPTTTTPSPPINAPQFDCTGRANGFYSNGNCDSSYFYSCLGGTSTALQCSPGLVFDTMSNNCDYREECGKPKTTVPPQAQDPVKPNLEHGTSGYYFNSGNRQYFNVAYSQSYSNPNAMVQQQVVPSVPQQIPAGPNVAGTNGQGEQQPPQSQPFPPQSPSTPASSSQFSCAGKLNGYYVQRQCTRKFYSCSNGITTHGTCPGGLVFDMQRAQCEFPTECGQSTSSISPPGQSQQPQQQILPSTQNNNAGVVPQPQPSSPAVAPSSSSFNCAGRRNGYYVKRQCTPEFYICSNGVPTKVTCPDGLVFDSQNSQCEFANTCGQSGTPNLPSASVPQVSSPSTVQTGQPQGTQSNGGGQNPAFPPQQQIPPIDCGGRPDGYYYKQPCRSSFVICASGIAVSQACPAGTVFEPESGRCQHESQCAQSNIAGGVQSPSANSQQQVPTLPSLSPQSQQPQNSIVPLQPAPSGGFSCAGKQNGNYYNQPCQSNWIICSGGQTINQNCPGSLVFNPSTAQCDFPTNCGKSANENAFPSSPPSSPSSPSLNGVGPSQPSQLPSPSQCGQCPSQSPVNQQPVQPASSQPSQSVVPSAPQIPSSPPAGPSSSTFCTGKQDGNYLQTQCQPNYVVCSGGFAMPQSCPHGLVFDSQTAQCEFPSECEKRQSSSNAQSSPTPMQPAAEMQPFKPAVQQQVVPTPPPRLPNSAQGFQCTRRIDGYYYRTACTPHFYTCVGGHATKLTCPGNLVFDPSNALCQYPDVCGRPSPPGQKGALTPAPQPPAPQTDFNCQGKRNGYYVKKGCTPHFYTCLGGIATKLTCPGNLVFDSQSASCQYPTICASQPQMPNAAPSVQSISPNAAPQSIPSPPPQSSTLPSPSFPMQPQPPQQIPPPNSNVMTPSTPTFDCTVRANGPYAIGECQNQYIQCSNGFAHQQQCPGSLVFSTAANNSCDFISSCQSASNGNSPNNVPQQPNQQGVNMGTVPNSPIINVPNSQPVNQPQQIPPSAPVSNQQVPVVNQQPNVQPVNPQIPSNSANQQQPQPQPNIPTANQSPPTQPRPSSGVQGQQLPPRPQNQPSPVIQTTNMACSNGNKSEGMYAQGCSDQFYACTGGITTQMNCPVGLYFDEETQRCDMRDLIVACGGQKNQTQQNGQDIGQRKISQSSTNSSNNNPTTPAPISPSEFDCSKRAIGYYSKGCSGRYYSCTGMTTYAFDCPTGLKYDQEASQCEYSTNVPECGGSRPTTPTPVAPPQPGQQVGEQRPNSGSPQPQPFSGQHPQQPMNNPCGQLPNGSYGPPCSAYYFYCNNGNPIEYMCPEGSVYQSSTLSCIPTQQVPSCAAA